MKSLLLLFLCCLCARTIAQDRIYMTDGDVVTGHITLMMEKRVVVELNNRKRSFEKNRIVLIEFEDGHREIFTAPSTDVLFLESEKTGPAPRKAEVLNRSQLAINTLALCNADVSVFFERHLQKRIGAGVMGAYNFNQGITPLNLYLAPLENARKRYDLGAFVNFYLDPPNQPGRSTVFFGLMTKYMRFDFTKITEVVKIPGGAAQLGYSPASGTQLTTLVTGGTHTMLGNNFFIKMMGGLGFFRMRGDYLEQFNYAVNRTTGNSVDGNDFLIKAYLCFNLGYSF